jgi:ATP-binding cassette subfamily B protein
MVIGLTIYFHKRLHTGFDQLFHRWGMLTAVVADALPGVRVIKAFGQEKREVNRFKDENSDFYNREVSMVNLWTLFGPLTMFCMQIGTILIWLVGGYWVTQGTMTVGTLMAFTGYMWMFYGPIHMVAHIDRMLNRAASSVQRIFEVLDTEPLIFSKVGAEKPQSFQGQIELQNVSFSYDGIRKVLKDVSLKIEPGTMVGLAGPSGGGKSTLINLICRFYDVLEGRILIDGLDVREYDVEGLRRHIGVVLQEPFLFHGTVARNIAYGQPDATLDQVIEAARAANAHDFIVGFPDGYDTMVGERGHTLSGGERQRISIARAILNNPKILILDEATSSVDTETEKLIQEALDRLISNRTTPSHIASRHSARPTASSSSTRARSSNRARTTSWLPRKAASTRSWCGCRARCRASSRSLGDSCRFPLWFFVACCRVPWLRCVQPCWPADAEGFGHPGVLLHLAESAAFFT